MKLFSIHIPKTGGTSVRTLCAKHKIDRMPLTSFHDAAIQCREKYKDEFENRFKYTIVRNPWDRMVSVFHYYKHNWKKEGHKHISDKLPKDFKTYVLNYCKKGVDGPISEAFDYPEINQINWITDEDGKLLVDYIIRFENLEQDTKEMFKKIGFANYENISIPLIRKSNNRLEDYREHYDEETKEIIKDFCDADINYFKYEF
ncbi:MAG: sulfotransferase family 2 domain-containing protein [Candidatus Lokiarchaeota archaeon]|nr:sulfotransferase family 2 domain-containing protein [Candidatus Lokiarchaeota archaeon]